LIGLNVETAAYHAASGGLLGPMCFQHRIEMTASVAMQPKMFSRPRRHAPFTNDTLHAFQRKPNKSHDLYNKPYQGTLTKKRPTSGPERKDLRIAKMRKHEEARLLKHQLKALR
jgi:hypothetical protein